MESLLCLLVEVFLPLELRLRPAEHKVIGTGSKTFASGSLGVPVVIVSGLLFLVSVVYDSVRPRELQHARLPCASPSPGACSNVHPLSQWCHPTILSSVIPFSSCLQSFPASVSFQMSQLSAWGGQSIGASASASVLLVNHQDDLLAVQGTLKSLLQHHG